MAGDVTALFAEYHTNGEVELLVRAKHDRVFPDRQTLFARLQSAPAQGQHSIRVDRASARDQKAFFGRNARLAETEVRWQELEFPSPKRERKNHRTLSPIWGRTVRVAVADNPAGHEPLKGH